MSARTFLLICIQLLWLPMAQAAGPIEQPDVVRRFFANHCASCHGEKKQKAKLRVDTLKMDYDAPVDLAHWEEIMNRINSGDMPPEDETRPVPDDVTSVAAWISKQLAEAEIVSQQNRESGVAWRKLTRREYANTIRDLLGVTYEWDAPTALPEDPDWHGFERIGSVLTLSPSHVEKYLAAAENALDEALALGERPEQKLIQFTPFNTRWNSRHQTEFEARGLADLVRLDIIPNNHVSDTWNVSIHATGDYRVRVKLSGLRSSQGRAPRLKISLEGVDRTIFEQEVDTPELDPIVIETVTHLSPGTYRMRVANAVPGPSPGARRSRNGMDKEPFIGFHSRAVWQLKLTDDEFKPIEPTLLIDFIEWEGPMFESWPTPAHRRIFFQGEDAEETDEYARQIFARFAERAWRRPVKSTEVDRLFAVYEKTKAFGKDFTTSVRSGLLAILCSKSFIYLEEGYATDADSDGEQTITDWQLASRLSYFLWSTMPDQRLLDLAKSGTLHETEVLRKEVRRMLADPRAARFAESFPYQWLQLCKVGMFPPDEELYPTYDDALERGMIKETTSFFAEVLNKNLSIRSFLDSDWSMLNERVAKHYGIEGVRGEGMRRVALPPNGHRGGILTHGSILGLTSDGTRHRPVHRGVWLLETILDDPPPPPPANVPPLEAPTNDTQKLSVRQRLELHRKDPNCASCHRRIDPLGIAFDHYDAIGRWRTVETLKIGTGQDPAIDASGELYDGRPFKDSNELKQLLLNDINGFAFAFTNKLATYGLRRGMTFADRPQLRAIAARAKSSDYALATLVEELVVSDLFQWR